MNNGNFDEMKTRVMTVEQFVHNVDTKSKSPNYFSSQWNIFLIDMKYVGLLEDLQKRYPRLGGVPHFSDKLHGNLR